MVQLVHKIKGRHIALVEEPRLILLKDMKSIYELALLAIDRKIKVQEAIENHLSEDFLDYDSIYEGKGDWKLLPSFDHPYGPFGCMVSGTGLTHHNSALNRQMMHQSNENKPTDSIQIYEWGVQGGSPAKGQIGIQPEWFYKGNGSILRAHGQALEVPEYADDGGEEPELAGIYIIDRKGQPWRIGLSIANEFSDHVMEKKNYLYLAPSKLRNCAIGPELVLDADFSEYKGKVSIQRNGFSIWDSDIKTGEKNMSHNLVNLEYHHFKYESHRLPLQAHVHFFGADAFSFGNGLKLQQGDEMTVEWQGLGRALKNPLEISTKEEKIISVTPLE
jgi:hypothetical protein